MRTTESRRCPDLRDLCAFLDGECEAAGAASIRGHLAGCEGCRGALAALRAADVVVRNADPCREAVLDEEGVIASVLAGMRDRGKRGARDPEGVPARGSGTTRWRTTRWRTTRWRTTKWRTTKWQATKWQATKWRGRGGWLLLAGAAALVVAVLAGPWPARQGPLPAPETSPGTREASARPAGSPGRAVRAPRRRPALPGMQTLAFVEEDWPRRCAQRAEALFDKAVAAAGASSPAPRAAALDEVVQGLRALGSHAARVLRSNLRGTDEERSRLAYEILLRLRLESTLDDLVRGAKRHGRIRDLLGALRAMASPRSVAYLRGLGGSEDPGTAALAAEALQAVPGAGAVEALADLARSGGAGAAAAVEALSRRGGSRSLRALVALHDERRGDPVIRLALRSRAGEAAPLLRRRLLEDADPARSRDAMEMLGTIRDRGAVPLLLDAMRRDDLRDEAARALLRIGDPEGVIRGLAWMDLHNPGAGSGGGVGGGLAAAARSLGPQALDRLASTALRKRGDAGRNAVRILGLVGPPAAGRLARILRGGNHREETVRALAGIEGEEARGALAAALRDPARSARVLEDLIRCGHGEIASSLLRGMLRERGGGRAARRTLARLERDHP